MFLFQFIFIGIVVSMYDLVLAPTLFKFNFMYILISLISSLIFYYFTKYFNFKNIISSDSCDYFIKLILLSTLLISMIIHIIVFWFFIKINSNINNFIFYQNSAYLPGSVFFKVTHFSFFNFNFSLEFFGLIFVLLAYIVGFISFISLDGQFFYKNMRFVFVCTFLILVIYLFSIVNDFLFFFILYECLLIPSFLFVYYTSTYRKGIQASLYFLIWTQLGSFLVLTAFAYIVNVVGDSSFAFFRNFIFTNDEILFLYGLFFFGFGFKIPIWPFHFWLTKTHVEAPAGFSIFLSGFLVKSAVYGFYRLTNLLGGNLDVSFFSIFIIMGVLDASLKMWCQIDLKKLVAYCTIQEMSLLYLAFIWGDSLCFLGGLMLCVTHALLSPLMFYIVDCIQKRYKTRLIPELSGILHLTPNLGISIIVMLVLYSGLPGTLKFLSEFYIYSGLVESMPIQFIIIIITSNFLGLIGFSKSWFNVLFGMNLKYSKNIPVDLTLKELLVICMCVLLLFLFNYLFNTIL